MTHFYNATQEYHNLVHKILTDGNDRGDRTRTGTRSLFGEQMKFDLTKSFPLITTKKLSWKSIAHELLWLVSGSTNIKYLQDKGVTIWDEWADENGDLGPVYGQQWRKWHKAHIHEQGGDYDITVDQLKEVIELIKTKPEDRRLIVTAWNPADVPKMKLPPCHMMYQFYTRADVDGNRFLDCHMYQRSADIFLGVPFNIASYALLTHMVAHVTNLLPGKLTISFGDVHIYNNHFDQVEEQLKRNPYEYKPPQLNVRGTEYNNEDIDGFVFEDFLLTGYEAYPSIKAPVAV